MKISNIFKILFSGSLFYVIMAACSSQDPLFGSGGGTGQGGMNYVSSSNSLSSSNKTSGTIMNPVPDASADPIDGSRLKNKFYSFVDGTKTYLSGIWYDSQLQIDCNFLLSSDNQMRCLPYYDNVAAVQYSDPNCINAIAYSCQPVKYAKSYDSSICGNITNHIYPIQGNIPTPPIYYAKNNGICGSLGSPPAGFTFYSVGPEISPNTFVAGSIQHD